jgi:hypothetical protein
MTKGRSSPGTYRTHGAQKACRVASARRLGPSARHVTRSSEAKAGNAPGVAVPPRPSLVSSRVT